MIYRFSAAVFLLSAHFFAAIAEPLGPMEELDLSLTINDAGFKIQQGSRFYDEAKKLCQDAEGFLAKYDRTPLQNAMVIQCFADVEVGGKHIKEACGLYVRALRDYEATPSANGPLAPLPKVMAWQKATEQIKKIRADNKKLGCSTGRYVIPINPLEALEQEKKVSDTCAGKNNVSPDAQIAACNSLLPKAIRKKEFVALAYTRRANGYIRKGDYRRALSDYTEAVRVDGSMESLEGRGSLYELMGRYNLALADYNKAVKTEPDRWWHYTKRASLYELMGKQKEAQADLDVAFKFVDDFTKKDPGNASMYWRRGAIYAQKGDYGHAIADYDEALRLSPDLGNKPDPVWGLDLAEMVIVDRGIAYFNKAEYNKALADFDRKIQLDPKNSTAFYNRGLTYLKLNQYDKGIADQDQAILLDPANARALNSRCFAKVLLDRAKEALLDCNESLRLRPGFADTLGHRGLAYLKLAQFGNAIADYDAVLRQERKNADALYGRGFARLKKGDKARAAADMAAAKAINASIADDYAKYGLK